MFSPDQFLDMQINEANDTKFVPVPVGEYTGVISEAKPRPWSSKDDPSKAGYALDVMWELDSQQLREMLGRDKITVKQSIMLDLIEDATGLDMSKGRNVGLGQLREALNLNVPGQPFAFSMLPGRIAKVRVEHRVVGDQIYAEVKKNNGVTRA
jgi:hypothetical protein